MKRKRTHMNHVGQTVTGRIFAGAEKYCAPEAEAQVKTSIRFKNQALSELRGNLLADLDNEYLAVLLAKEERVGDLRVLTVLDAAYPPASAYKRQGETGLRVDFDAFMKGVLEDVDTRFDVDAVIDVHTHPFAKDGAWFSGTDDADESAFAAYLAEYGIHYASIVLSQTDYLARYWGVDDKGCAWRTPAQVKTQKAPEQIPCATDARDTQEVDVMVDRSVRALGLDVMRRIADAQNVTVVGVGGLGSVVAEHLVHMGFTKLNLVDFDKLETTNMNRIVGATYADAQAGVLKVDAVKAHLTAINPKAQIECFANSVFDAEVESAIAASDWVIVATDNHASRFHVQELCFRYFVPFITAGVNITVKDGVIDDMSGEVVLVRMGDHVCLSCLGRVNYNEVAKECHPDPVVREGLVAKGYVSGMDVHEPAVKTLNTMLATMAVDTLVNQYTERQRDVAVLVYENNQYPTIYEDKASVDRRKATCACAI